MRSSPRLVSSNASFSRFSSQNPGVLPLREDDKPAFLPLAIARHHIRLDPIDEPGYPRVGLALDPFRDVEHRLDAFDGLIEAPETRGDTFGRGLRNGLLLGFEAGEQVLLLDLLRFILFGCAWRLGDQGRGGGRAGSGLGLPVAPALQRLEVDSAACWQTQGSTKGAVAAAQT